MILKLRHLIRYAEVRYHQIRSYRHVTRCNGWTREEAKAHRARQLASIGVQRNPARDTLIRNLMQLCVDAGMTNMDAATSIEAYLTVGPLTGRQVADYTNMTVEARTDALSRVYGADGARVAALVVAHAH